MQRWEHQGFCASFGLLPASAAALFIAPEAVTHLAAAVAFHAPDAAALAIAGLKGYAVGFKFFPTKNKRKILKKYGDGGKAVRRRQMKFYAAGVALCCAYGPAKHFVQKNRDLFVNQGQADNPFANIGTPIKSPTYAVRLIPSQTSLVPPSP